MYLNTKRSGWMIEIKHMVVGMLNKNQIKHLICRRYLMNLWRDWFLYKYNTNGYNKKSLFFCTQTYLVHKSIKSFLQIMHFIWFDSKKVVSEPFRFRFKIEDWVRTTRKNLKEKLKKINLFYGFSKWYISNPTSKN